VVALTALFALTSTLLVRESPSQPSSSCSGSAFAAPALSRSALASPTWGRVELARTDVRQAGTAQAGFGCSAASEPLRHALHFGLKIQQWKDHWIGPVNLSRQDLRISGMENYAVVAVVLLQVVVGFYSGVAEPEDGDAKWNKVLYEIQMALLMAATLCSTFTMIMFLLNKICDVTALGLYKDVAYATFHAKTARHRVTAFWSIFVAMSSFLGAFSIDLLRRVQGKRGLALKIASIITCLTMLLAWTKFMFLAQNTVFQGNFRIG